MSLSFGLPLVEPLVDVKICCLLSVPMWFLVILFGIGSGKSIPLWRHIYWLLLGMLSIYIALKFVSLDGLSSNPGIFGCFLIIELIIISLMLYV